MKVQQVFEQFLESAVNLNASRITKIKDAIRILPSFISESDVFKDVYIKVIPQGSYRQKTIIKPKGDDQSFDLDLGIIVKKHPSWEPKDYLSNLAKIFAASGRYKDLTDTIGKTRCVTIDYEGDFHVDLVPTIFDGINYWVCNKTTNKLEPSDGEGYANWFSSQNSLAAGNLVDVVRLLKYLRDYKGDFDTKSIILTTIAAKMVNARDVGSYQSIPAALQIILARIDQFLSQFSIPPSIENPAMPGETFNRHWRDDQPGFEALKKSISKYSLIATDAIQQDNENDELETWLKLFGEEFRFDDTPIKRPESKVVFSAPFTPEKPWSNNEAD